MRIILIGNVEFSEKILKKLIALKADIVGVVTTRRSKFNADFCDLGKACRQNGIECRYVISINEPEHIRWIAERKPDVIFCFGFSQLLKKEILRIPRLGAIGYHPAKLPEHRGRHPIVWALVRDLKRTYSTFFLMTERADEGDIISQICVPIRYKDNAGSLYKKILKAAVDQIVALLPRLKTGKYQRIMQDSAKAGYWRKRNQEDGRVDFQKSSRTVYNLVRALARPYIGAHVHYKGNDIKVWRGKEVRLTGKDQKPGCVLKVSRRNIYVRCNSGAVCFTEHDFRKFPKAGENIL